MKKIFADTSYWIALINKADKHHEKSKEVSSSLENYCIVTTELILIEVINTFSSHGEYLKKCVIETTDKIKINKSVEVKKLNQDQFQLGYMMFKKYLDKGWSLTDCVSFIIMREEDIEEVLSADKHFTQAGFKILL